MPSSAFTELFIDQCVYNIVGLFIEVMQKESEAKSIFYSFQFFSNKNRQFRALTKTNMCHQNSYCIMKGKKIISSEDQNFTTNKLFKK